ncbi:beta-propeller domain-containing protein [Paenibacillus thermoaerophilus]|uniref:Beta-propeller domain-containing protein n=1 Tax=Paenibacillus thermoaerophilus TaxID=1215385 RepID=A0ABW2V2R7_9BACL|nr:beta-propeller domain-containing protein [Paenibacillus thermoaerophilus]TMV14384.1 hypothetical protein FE781_10705 [Paenibacillus thermoaerophilus]
MLKKTATAVLLAAALVAAPAAAPAGSPAAQASPAQGDAVNVTLRGKPMTLDTPAVLVGGTTLVPLRPVAEALGATVEWKEGSDGRHTVTLSRGGETAVVTLGDPTLTASGRTIRLDVAPMLKDGVTMVPLRAIGEALGAVVYWDAASRTALVDDPAELPVIGNAENLRELLEKTQQLASVGRMTVQVAGAESGSFIAVDQIGDTAKVRSEAKTESAAPSETGTDTAGYSKTNVQVDGVDESDWAKTDGRFIYQLSGSRVRIADIADPSAPKLAATLDYSSDSFRPQELYADGGRLVVIGQSHELLPADTGAGSGADQAQSSGSVQPEAKKIAIWPVHPTRTTVKTLVYEIDQAGQPKLVRETELEGNYVSSRKIGGALYLISNKYTHVYHILENAKANSKSVAGSEAAIPPEASFEPVYRDSASGGEAGLRTLPLDRIRYFPESPESNVMMIGALDLDRPEQEMQVSAYLGSGQTVYASTKHLYVAVGHYIPKGEHYRQETKVYKFRLDQGRVLHVGEGSVPGTVLNQFSLDEHDGYLRIATTKGDMWASGEATSKNNVYVLNEQLKQVGALEDLAPGERIYSVRFMGGRAYMVTFRNVDPLFAIDLRDPAKPAVLGQLKIPGYSDYLHPYDENHLIGFGKETIELPSKGAGPDATMAFYQGMKIALFDVSDVTQPKEKFKEVIGDRGTHSDLLSDHKALLFSREKGLMAFPVQLMEIKDKSKVEAGELAYGEFTYQGAYVYGIDLQEGFKLRGRITHLTNDDLAKSGQYGYDYDKSVRRILYAGHTLYTLSEAMLKANDLDSLAELGSLTYPALPKPKPQVYPKGEPMPMPAR